MESSAPEVVKSAVTTASIISHVKNNRVEYLLAIGLLHLLGVSDRLLAQVSGMCF
jgi:hypothetical protein